MTDKKIKVALMSYAMDNRKAKGTALYTRKLIENLLDDERFEFYLVHYEKVDDPLYKRAKEILARAFEMGVLIRVNKNVVIIKPPLTITTRELDFAFEILNEVFASLTVTPRPTF